MHLFQEMNTLKNHLERTGSSIVLLWAIGELGVQVYVAKGVIRYNNCQKNKNKNKKFPNRPSVPF
jgi:hypothetical protein